MELRDGTPEEVGLRPDIVPLIRERAQAWAKDGNNPSIVLLAARRGVVFFHEAFGVESPEESAPPLSTDALFPLASLTKPFTATALLTLVEEGKVGLNRPVQDYVPEFASEGADKMVVHNLLTHTSGLSDEDFERKLEELENGLESIDVPTPPETQTLRIARVLSLAYELPLRFEPGTEMNYSDLGIYLVGEIVRRISGKSLAQFYSERIYEPLGMNSSYMVVPKEEWGRVVRRQEDAPGATMQNEDWFVHPSPSGGMFSTADDVARFGQMLLNRGSYGKARILSPASVDAMTRNQIPGVSAEMLDVTFPEASWGLGISVAHPLKRRVYGEALPSPAYFNHGGYAGVELWVDPENEIVGTYFSVALDVDDADFTRYHADLFMNLVTSAVNDGWQYQEPSPARVAGPHILSDGSPEEAGADPERVANLIAIAREWVEEGTYPALAMVAARRGVVFLEEYMGSGSDGTAAAADMVFPLASITKPITATAILALVEDGLVGLNREVRDYIPEFEGEHKHLVLVRNLLTHTSGLSDEALYKAALAEGVELDAEAPYDDFAVLMKDSKNWLDLACRTPLANPPVQVMVYADANFDLLAEIVRRVSGKSLGEFAQERIFGPLGMKDSAIAPADASFQGRVVSRPSTAPGAAMLEAARMSGEEFGSVSGFGTARDLTAFGQVFLNGGIYGDARILSQASVAAMTRNQIPGIPAHLSTHEWPESEWGLGWGITETKKSFGWNELLPSRGSFAHGGSGGVFILVDPGLELVASFFSVQAKEDDEGMPVSNTDLFVNAVVASITEI